jgi:nucleoid-associated protein YgaU
VGDAGPGTVSAHHQRTTSREHPRPTVVVVRPGDSLWSITADLSPPEASDVSLAKDVHRLYTSNRSAIGDDPDLIYPETTLRVPGGLS